MTQPCSNGICRAALVLTSSTSMQFRLISTPVASFTDARPTTSRLSTAFSRSRKIPHSKSTDSCMSAGCRTTACLARCTNACRSNTFSRSMLHRSSHSDVLGGTVGRPHVAADLTHSTVYPGLSSDYDYVGSSTLPSMVFVPCTSL